MREYQGRHIGDSQQRAAWRLEDGPAGGADAPFRAVEPAGYFRWKDLVGRAIALALLAPGVPIVLAAVAMVRLTSPGPGIFRQLRVGRNGKTFTMYKIRSMRSDAEKGAGPVWSTDGDPRVTWVGRILRALHIDEFPQLFNVLRGDMALIGPRPERPEFCQRLALVIPSYLERLHVRPGITGLAQINLPPDTDVDSVRRKLVLDLEYVARGNAWLDVRILLCTFIKLCGANGQTSARWLRLDRDPEAEQIEALRVNGVVPPLSFPIAGAAADNHAADSPNGTRRPAAYVGKST